MHLGFASMHSLARSMHLGFASMPFAFASMLRCVSGLANLDFMREMRFSCAIGEKARGLLNSLCVWFDEMRVPWRR